MPIVFSFPNDHFLADRIATGFYCQRGNLTLRHFPDGESYLKLNSEVEEEVILVCSLDHSDRKVMPLLFFSRVVREYGAKRVGLVCPYLGYMRQDKRFHNGEAISSDIFAQFLSSHFDWLLTVDPHLHRHKKLDEIYSIPTQVVHATPVIAEWIRQIVDKPLLVGPDEESAQWIKGIEAIIHAPSVILEKLRRGEREVVELGQGRGQGVGNYYDYTPVLVDDIISTGQTMMETAHHLYALGLKSPICIGIHPIFAGNSYLSLLKQVERVVSCNTIIHPSNEMDVSGLIVDGLNEFIA